jgi:predicted fused transcriptional regulator/phosphomethylpyrimidine kinase
MKAPIFYLRRPQYLHRLAVRMPGIGMNSGEEGILEALSRSLTRLEAYTEMVDLIPQVGINMVYSKPSAKGVRDVAGLSGRVIESMGAPKVCGEVVFGGSQHLALVVVELVKLEPRLRAAVNIKGRRHVAEALERMGLDVVVLPPARSEGCAVADYINEKRKIHDAYYHPGAFGIEPTTTIVAQNPDTLVETLIELSRLV